MRAAERVARTRALIMSRRLERYAMARRPEGGGPDWEAMQALVERAATPDELMEARAALAVAPGDRQGRLL
jgi:hypothetical protein